MEQTLRIIRAQPSDKRKYEEQNKRDSGARLYKQGPPFRAPPPRPSSEPASTGEQQQQQQYSGEGAGG